MCHKIIEKMHIAEQVLDKETSDIPLVYSEDEPAVSALTRAKIASKVKDFDVSLIPAIHEGIQVIAGYDQDYAKDKNDIGFNAIDTRVGHWLAQKAVITTEQAIVGMEMIKKYRKQLPHNLYCCIFESKEEVF
jgi:hypothetical protein